jgi:imidazolonepropionase
MTVDHVWHHCRLATLSPKSPGLGLVEDGLIAASGGKIVYAGPARDAPTGLDAKQRTDCAGRWITPGLVDCHTHLVYGGDRAEEFELRLAGASYEELSKRGGGIASTVKATRLATEDQLVAFALPRLDALIAEGVTTIEIKSGYGLDLATESRQLRAARRLAKERRIDVHTSFLGAHAMPPEAKGDTSAYIDTVCAMLPTIAAEGLADSVDAFCDNIGFSHEETTRVFEAAKKLKLPMRLHADQLANLHGAALAAKYGALSADHLERTDEAGIVAMKASGTVAVILPGAYYFIRETQLPPIEAMRRHGVPIAISTDCNPGSSPLTSLLLTMNMGATLFRLTVDECIAGTTREAAKALGLWDRKGSLEAGKDCDLAIWDIERPAELVYRIGFNPLHQRVFKGTA